MRCAAIAKSTGEQCTQWVVVGSSVCRVHGASTTAARAKADLRMSLAQLLGQDPRPPWQVLLDALATTDAIMQDSIAVVRQQGASLTPDQLERLVDAVERAAKLSKITIDANVGERRTRLLESQTQLMTGAIQAGLDAVFAGLVDKLGLDPAAEVELRQVALEAVAQHAEQAGSAAADPRGTQRFVRNANAVRRIQAELSSSSTAPGSTGEDSAEPRLTQDEIARAQARYAEQQARRAELQADDPQPAGQPGPPDLRIVPPGPPPSPLEE